MGTRDAAFLRVFAKRLTVPALSRGIGMAAGTGAGSEAHALSIFASVIMSAFTVDLTVDFLNLL